MTSFLNILKNLQENSVQQSGIQNRVTSKQQLQNYQTQEQIQIMQQQQYHGQINQNNCCESFMEYVPFRRKVVEFDERVYRRIVPRRRKEWSQIQHTLIENVPRQIIKTDYFAVQHLIQYRKQIIPEKTIEYVPVIKTIKKIEYVPVERKIIHYHKDFENEFQTMNQQSESIFQVNQSKSMFQVKLNPQSQTKSRQVFSPIKTYVSDQSLKESRGADWVEESQKSVLMSLRKIYSNDNQIQSDKKRVERQQITINISK